MFANLSMNKLRKSKNMSESENRLLVHKFGVNLTEIEVGKSAKIRELHGNNILMKMLKSMGIIPDAIIIKKSAILSEGPIVIEKGPMQFAVGYEMARNIIVDPI
ncbi:FeoA family protein [Clostridium sp. AWRP]|uniref:FeoA family protein n=1 Tax=Clostridium sp. AWRP TaxID=2212991 RepID=UPI001586615B|nr:FeoA family protein [Clostridium sp. AWRP]